jgi:hypothetical protein
MLDQDGWYIARDGEQGGPLTDREMQEFIRGGYLHSEDLIWRRGFDNWQRAGDISVFLQLLPSPPGKEGAELPGHGGRPANNGPATVSVSKSGPPRKRDCPGCLRVNSSDADGRLDLPLGSPLAVRAGLARLLPQLSW